MFGLPLGIVVETLVAILLATTIGYCVMLNQRLKRLHSDRGELRQMVADLVQATGLANAAIQELKATAQEAETVLEARLGEAEKFGVELANHVSAGQQIMERLARITNAARAQPLDDRRIHRHEIAIAECEHGIEMHEGAVARHQRGDDAGGLAGCEQATGQPADCLRRGTLTHADQHDATTDRHDVTAFQTDAGAGIVG